MLAFDGDGIECVDLLWLCGPFHSITPTGQGTVEVSLLSAIFFDFFFNVLKFLLHKASLSWLELSQGNLCMCLYFQAVVKDTFFPISCSVCYLYMGRLLIFVC